MASAVFDFNRLCDKLASCELPGLDARQADLLKEFRQCTDGLDFSSLSYQPPETLQLWIADNHIHSIVIELFALQQVIAKKKSTPQ